MQHLVVTGAAGLVGQNLIPRLKKSYRITAIDKNASNSEVLRRLHPDVNVTVADIASEGAWENQVATADAIACLHAQIGGLDPAEFERNNVIATSRLIRAAERAANPFFVHVSSSVVNSMADDLYTRTKKAQEALVRAALFKSVILRPTLMFGWFDRKHLGWLRRFMDRTPVFPIPGNGQYMRQPLYAGDFAAIVASCIENRTEGEYNISGLERVPYVDLIRMIKQTVGAKASIVNIPYAAFWTLLAAYSVVDRDPPFTVSQLKALVTPDLFEEIDWPGIFSVQRTTLKDALAETFLDATYGSITLEF